jgi:serine/threonine protein kinase
VTSPWQPGASLLGEFEVERELGGGGFGRVALVRNRRSGERYAVKRVLVTEGGAQHRFLTEAQRWIGLPEHPHIAACRFVRTVEHELLVFSEYVAGGSIADWIRSGRLYDGENPVATVVRIAREAAWGLGAAHETGLLHLDVKPANVLLTEDGSAKLTDFGLATGAQRDPEAQMQFEAIIDSIAGGPELDEDQRNAVRAIIRRELTGNAEKSIRAVPEGFSIAYASPEQAEGAELGRSADVWSWATTVLEMFAGERTWPSGALADAVLERLTAGPGNRWRIVPPAGVIDLLRACLQPDPAARPSSVAPVAEALAAVEAGELGLPARPVAPRPAPAGERPETHGRRLVSGGSWSDPRAELFRAYETAGLDPSAAAPFFPSGRGSRKAQAYEDLRALSEARRVLDGVPGAATPDLRWRRARLAAETGRVQLSIGNTAGGIADLRAGVDLLAGADDEDTLGLLISVLDALANALRGNGETAEALTLHDRALDLAEGLPRDEAGLRTLGNALLSKANTLTSHQARADALPLYDRAVDCFERAGETVGLAKALAAKATQLKAMDRAVDMEAMFELADEYLRNASTPIREDLLGARAQLSLNRAILAETSAEQLRHAGAAAEQLTTLVRDRGWHELAGDLGRARLETGRAHEMLGQPRPALAAYREARSTFTDAVVRDGRSDLAEHLAEAYDHESTLVGLLEGPAAAVVVSTRAVELWQRLAALDGPASLAIGLAKALQKLGTALMDTGDPESARLRFEEALRQIPGSMLDAPGARLTLAHTHRAYGVLLRTSGNPGAACRRYEEALAVLGEPRHHDRLAARSLILESLAGALGDAGRYGDAIRAQRASLTDLELLARQGRQTAQLAGSYQRLSNALLQTGDLEAAKNAAATALAKFETLIAAGRDDLVEEAARQRASYGAILHRLADIDGAAAALAAARDTYVTLGGTDARFANVARVLGSQVDALRELIALGPGDVDAWLGRQRSALEQAGQLSRGGDTRHASLQLEEIIGSLIWVKRHHPTVEGFVLTAQAGTYLGITAMHAGRDAAARHGFVTAIDNYRPLAAYDRRLIDDWAKAHVGLAAHLALMGDDEGAGAVVDRLEADIGELDRASARRWRAHAEEQVAEMRTLRNR